jgi:hypothetical protein
MHKVSMLCPLYSKGFRLLCHPDRIIRLTETLKFSALDLDRISQQL